MNLFLILQRTGKRNTIRFDDESKRMFLSRDKRVDD